MFFFISLLSVQLHPVVIAIPYLGDEHPCPSQLLMFTRVSSLGDPPDPWDDVRLDELSKSMDGRLLELEKSSRAAVPWFVGMVGLGLVRWTMVIMVHPLLMFDDIRNIYIYICGRDLLV